MYVHNNLRLLFRNPKEHNKKETKMWDIGGDGFDSFQDVGIQDFAILSLDEPTMEIALFVNDGEWDNEAIGLVSTSSWHTQRRL